MANEWNWQAIKYKESGGWTDCLAYENNGGTWDQITPYIAATATTTLYTMEVGEYTSGNSTRGYDPFVSPSWYDGGSLTPPYMWHYNVWRIRRSGGRVVIKLSGGKMGKPEEVKLRFPDNGQVYNFVQSSNEEWENSEQSLMNRFDADNLTFYLNDEDQSLPPMNGDYHMRVGYSYGPEHARGYVGYDPNDAEWEDHGELTPSTTFGFKIWRFNALRDSRVKIKLTLGTGEDPGDLAIRFENGLYFPISYDSGEEWVSNDEDFINLFYHNSDLYFYIDKV